MEDSGAAQNHGTAAIVDAAGNVDTALNIDTVVMCGITSNIDDAVTCGTAVIGNTSQSLDDAGNPIATHVSLPTIIASDSAPDIPNHGDANNISLTGGFNTLILCQFMPNFLLVYGSPELLSTHIAINSDSRLCVVVPDTDIDMFNIV
jgi:hypothetical protein